MRTTMKRGLVPIGAPLAVALAVTGAGIADAPGIAQTVAAQPTATVALSIGRGRLVTLSRPMSDVFVADEKIADVQVRTPTQLYIFGKAAGETTIYATAKGGAVVYSSNIRVGSNIDSVQQMLNLALPDAKVTATTMNGLVLLTGTVAAPDDGAEAERLTQAFVGDQVKVLSRLKTATPLQVNLQFRQEYRRQPAEPRLCPQRQAAVQHHSGSPGHNYDADRYSGRSLYAQWHPGRRPGQSRSLRGNGA